MSVYFSNILKHPTLLKDLEIGTALSYIKDETDPSGQLSWKSAVLNVEKLDKAEWEKEFEFLINKGCVKFNDKTKEVSDKEYILTFAKKILYDKYGTSKINNEKVNLIKVYEDVKIKVNSGIYTMDFIKSKINIPEYNHWDEKNKCYSRDYTDFEKDDLCNFSVSFYDDGTEMVWGRNNMPAFDSPAFYVSKAFPDNEYEYISLIENDMASHFIIQNGEVKKELPLENTYEEYEDRE